MTLPTNGIQYCTVDSYLLPSRFVPLSFEGLAFWLSQYTPVGVSCDPFGVPDTMGDSHTSAPVSS